MGSEETKLLSELANHLVAEQAAQSLEYLQSCADLEYVLEDDERQGTDEQNKTGEST